MPALPEYPQSPRSGWLWITVAPPSVTMRVTRSTSAGSAPNRAEKVLTAVLESDDRPQARARLRFAAAAAGATFKPLDSAKIRRMPWGTGGAGQTLAIMEIGGGFGQGALDTYFFGLGIAKSTTTTVGVDNAVNTPGNDPGR
jgi:kumamolisin